MSIKKRQLQKKNMNREFERVLKKKGGYIDSGRRDEVNIEPGKSALSDTSRERYHRTT